MHSTSRLIRSVVAGSLLLAGSAGSAAFAQLPPSLPQVVTPPSGDPRLEPIPASAVQLVNVTVFGGEKTLSLKFPPRVNGQQQSDGDRSSGMWVLFNSATNQPIAQPPVLETIPYGAGSGVTDFSARQFSATWVLHALLVDPSYNPSNPATRIDTAAEITTSPLVVADLQTNIFVNGPVIPVGSTVTSPSPQPIQAFTNGQLVSVVLYEVSDGPFSPQTMFRFVNPSGTVLGDPYLVASHIPGDSFYSPVWEIVSVQVPAGFDVTTLKSLADVQNTGFPNSSAQIRVNGPVVSINGQPVPFVNPMSLLTAANGTFNPAKFPFTLPATTTSKSRTFVLTSPRSPVTQAPSSPFPRVADAARGNVIPLILTNPFQLQSSGPNSAGTTLRIDQAELDSARSGGLLPAAIENNFTQLIAAGVLSSDWGPSGTHTYQERLGLVGRALIEQVWQTSQGANAQDVTACLACHSQPAAGGAARASFILNGKQVAGSMWGSGAEELLRAQLVAAGVTGLSQPHGGAGTIKSIRTAAGSAPNTHIGMQSAEFVATKTGNPGGFNPTLDFDQDGVANELSVGEVTAMTAFLMSLPVPDQASPAAMSRMGISLSDVQAGKSLFRTSIDNGGAGCFSCHTPFFPLTSTTFQLANPQTATPLPLDMPHHVADQEDVDEGLADFVGQIGLHLYGDIRVHKMGALDKGAGTDMNKTAELWDVGSVAPYLRNGAALDLRSAVAAHEGVYLTSVELTRGAQFNRVIDGQKVSGNVLTVRNTSGAPINASPSAPIRIVLSGTITPGIQAFNAPVKSVDGGFRQGAAWLITSPISAGGSVNVTLLFANPNVVPLQYDVVAQDNNGYSEAVAFIRAFNALSATGQQQILTFLRAQLINDGEGEQ